jgi:tyrosyl-tRNA synthetase
LKDGQIWICKLIVLAGFAPSNGEARRLVSQGAVNIGPDRLRIDDAKANIEVADGLLLRVGGRRIGRVKLVN